MEHKDITRMHILFDKMLSNKASFMEQQELQLLYKMFVTSNTEDPFSSSESFEL